MALLKEDEMKKLCLVTYTRSSEGFTKELIEIADSLNNIMNGNFKVVICCEDIFKIDDYAYKVELVKKGGTKYRRLINIMEIDDSEFYISVDNDITGNIPQIVDFIRTMISNNYEIGWGRIQANKQKNFISNMVAVDKLLSHNIIRPLLWKMKVGISIPGQIFCIKGKHFRGKLMDFDTFLDDLALGLYVNINNCNKYVTNSVLGYEEPNSKFTGLWKQRQRWAIGYASILQNVFKKKNYLCKVLIHGVSYHASWILNWTIIICLFKCFCPLAFLYMLVISILIAKNELILILYSLIYQVIFPIFHIKWGLTLIKELFIVKE